MSAAILSPTVCACDIIYKAGMRGTSVCYVVSLPSQLVNGRVVKREPTWLHPEELKAEKVLLLKKY